MHLVLPPSLSSHGTSLGPTRTWKRGSAAPLRDQFGCWAPAGGAGGAGCGSRPRGDLGMREVLAALGESCWKDSRGLLKKPEHCSGGGGICLGRGGNP